MRATATAHKADAKTSEHQSSDNDVGTNGVAMAPPSYGIAWIDDQPIQAKLAMSVPGDRYEREADRIADVVMNHAAANEPMPSVRMIPRARQAGPHAMSMHRPRPRGSGDGLSPGAEGKVRGVIRGGGAPLPPSVLAPMEGALGADLSDVRVHTGPAAIESARALQARAYTVGDHIVFDEGQYQPGTYEGKRLLAHEMAHVLHQRGAGLEMVHRWAWFTRAWNEVKQIPIIGSAAQFVEDTVEKGVLKVGELLDSTRKFLERAFDTLASAVQSAKDAVVKGFKAVRAAAAWILEIPKLISQIWGMIKKIKKPIMAIFENPMGLGRGYAVSLGAEITVMSIKFGAAAKEGFQRTPDNKLKLIKFVKGSVGGELGVGGNAGPVEAEASVGVSLDGMFKEEFEFDYDDPPLIPLIVAIIPISSTPLGFIIRESLPSDLNPNKHSKEVSWDIEVHASASAGAKASLGGSDKKSKSDSKSSSSTSSGTEEEKKKGVIASLLNGIGGSVNVDLYGGVGLALVNDEDDDGNKERLLRYSVKLGGEAKLELFAGILETFLRDGSIETLMSRYLDIPELKVAGEVVASIYFGASPRELEGLATPTSIRKLLRDPVGWIASLITKTFKKVEIQASSKPSDDASTMLGEGADITASFEAADGKKIWELFGSVPDELTISRRVEPEDEDALGTLVKNPQYLKAVDAIEKIPIATQVEKLLILEIKLAKPLLEAMWQEAQKQPAGKKPALWKKIFNFLVKSEFPEDLDTATLLEKIEDRQWKEHVEIEEATLRLLGGVKLGTEFEFGAGVKKSIGLNLEISAYQDTDLKDSSIEADLVANLRKLLEIEHKETKAQRKTRRAKEKQKAERLKAKQRAERKKDRAAYKKRGEWMQKSEKSVRWQVTTTVEDGAQFRLLNRPIYSDPDQGVLLDKRAKARFEGRKGLRGIRGWGFMYTGDQEHEKAFVVVKVDVDASGDSKGVKSGMVFADFTLRHSDTQSHNNISLGTDFLMGRPTILSRTRDA